MTALTLEYESRLSACRKHVFACVSLLLLVVLTYSNTFYASWHLDDGPNIVENRSLHLKEFSWPEIKKAFFSTPAASKIEFFRPLSRFTLAVNYYLGGDEVFGYHVANVSIHVVACMLLYLCLYHTLHLPLLRTRYAPYSYFIALMATTFWAVHPIQTQAVTYIVQRMTSMAGMFFIMAMCFYVQALRATRRRTRIPLQISCAVAGLLSLGSKENAVLLPVSLFLYHLLLVRGVTAQAARKTLTGFTWAYLLPVCAVLAYLSVFHDVVSQVFSLYDTRVFTSWERLLTETRVMVLYISLLFYPVPSRFSIDHPMVLSTSLFDPPSTFLSLLFLAAVLAAACLLSRREPILAFPLFFFFLNHAVESSILPIELVFEHRNYLPSLFLFVPVAIGMLKVLRSLNRSRSVRTLAAVTFSLILVALAHSAYVRNMAWKDEGTLWLDCLRKYPSSFRAHHNLGRYFSLRGEEREATSLYLKALACPEIHSRKEKGITFFNLGLLAHRRGDIPRASSYYRRALELDPCCPGAHNNLAGLLLDREGADLSEPLQLLNAALECKHDGEVSLALSNMGILQFKMGAHDKALGSLIRSLKMDPDNPLTLLRLGYVLKEAGHWGRASTVFMQLLDVNPRDPTGFLCLAEVYLRSGHTTRGMQIMTRLLDALPPASLTEYLREFGRHKTVADVTPDIQFLLPYLEEACRKKKSAFQGVLEQCLEIRRGKDRG